MNNQNPIYDVGLMSFASGALFVATAITLDLRILVLGIICLGIAVKFGTEKVK